MKLLSSNEDKLKEFNRYGIPMLSLEKGKDIKEVDSDPQTVVLYKAKEAGEGHIVEDTSLHIEGEDIGTNIRWKMDEISLLEGKRAIWELWLGVYEEGKISLYKGEVKGVIVNSEDSGFGFDPYFIPDGESRTLHQLEKAGEKDCWSARKLAVESYLKKEWVQIQNAEELPEWTGEYQTA